MNIIWQKKSIYMYIYIYVNQPKTKKTFQNDVNLCFCFFDFIILIIQTSNIQCRYIIIEYHYSNIYMISILYTYIDK